MLLCRFRLARLGDGEHGLIREHLQKVPATGIEGLYVRASRRQRAEQDITIHQRHAQERAYLGGSQALEPLVVRGVVYHHRAQVRGDPSRDTFIRAKACAARATWADVERRPGHQIAGRWVQERDGAGGHVQQQACVLDEAIQNLFEVLIL